MLERRSMTAVGQRRPPVHSGDRVAPSAVMDRRSRAPEQQAACDARRFRGAQPYRDVGFHLLFGERSET